MKEILLFREIKWTFQYVTNKKLSNAVLKMHVPLLKKKWSYERLRSLKWQQYVYEWPQPKYSSAKCKIRQQFLWFHLFCWRLEMKYHFLKIWARQASTYINTLARLQSKASLKKIFLKSNASKFLPYFWFS